MRAARRKTPSIAEVRVRGHSSKQTARAQGAPSPTALIESQIAGTSEPVLGLYLHVAYTYFMSTYEEQVGRGEITPNVIGILAFLAQRPGMSQADLARLVGLERATVGVTVARAIASGFVRRTDSSHDARRYSLYITAQGEQMLAKLRQRVPVHERQAARRLSLGERQQLRILLDKLVYG
jgi:DNA-binding MarR family transcriptional regulator